jgi:hypothetical protein
MKLYLWNHPYNNMWASELDALKFNLITPKLVGEKVGYVNDNIITVGHDITDRLQRLIEVIFGKDAKYYEIKKETVCNYPPTYEFSVWYEKRIVKIVCFQDHKYSSITDDDGNYIS